MSETEAYIESDAALGEVPNLLRDFAMLLRKGARESFYHEAVKFIRRERFKLATDYTEGANS